MEALINDLGGKISIYRKILHIPSCKLTLQYANFKCRINNTRLLRVNMGALSSMCIILKEREVFLRVIIKKMRLEPAQPRPGGG